MFHPILTTRSRQRDLEDQAWSEGYGEAEQGVKETLAEKDAFIAQQAKLLQDLAALNGVIDWSKLPDRLRFQLVDYL